VNTFTYFQKVWNFCHTFRTTIAGERLPYYPSDEAAIVLLARIQAKRAKHGTNNRRRGDVVTKASR